MKKLFIVLAVASLGFVSCNSSTDADAAAAEAQRIADSTRVADSLAKVEMEAAAAAAAQTPEALEAKRIADSIAAATAMPK